MFTLGTTTASLLALLAVTSGVNGAALDRRTPVIDSIIPFTTISAPVPGTSAAAGETFPLSYTTPFFGECPSSLYGLQMFLLDHVPTAADVTTVPNSSADIVDALFQFGEGWLGWIGSSSPPNIPTLPPLPLNLTMPDLGIPNTTLYFLITQFMDTCPGEGAAFDIVGVSYNAIDYVNNTSVA